jgi:hypothetical protein
VFRARGTRIVVDDIEAGKPNSGATAFSPSTEPEPVAPEKLGANPGLPVLPPDFKARFTAAQQGDLAAIEEMRTIGELVPSHMQLAFAEMVEDMLWGNSS